MRSCYRAVLLLVSTLQFASTVDVQYALAQSGEHPLRIASANPNTKSAGVTTGRTASVRMVVERALWYPEADTGPVVTVDAFGEEGARPSVPGPLIRVQAGTTLEITILNKLPDTLLVFGLSHTRSEHDTLRVAPGAQRVTRTTPDREGTFAYGGATIANGVVQPLGSGNQLLGALIVDGPRARADRVFIMSVWPPAPGRFVMAINGKSWPHTERIDVAVGDSVHWRVINGTRGRHPMHLHGFYFRIDARGSWFANTAITSDHPRVVTESVPLRGTFDMTWTAERAGNWLFHCHDALHTSWRRRYNLTGERPPPTLPMHDGAHHVEQDMSGLVLGIRARSRDVAPKSATLPEAQRNVRISINETAGFYGREPALSYAASDSGRGSVQIPARPLILTLGVPTAINVVNHTSIPTAVHWHGIELDSYHDGVAGWSGDDVAKAPLIAPRDSFLVRMTPPRAGTFMFHAHVDDMRQIALGLYGALIVLPPGKVWNPGVDHIFIVSQLGRGQDARIGLNGSAAPPPMDLAPGTHRFRFVNISIEDDAEFQLVRAPDGVVWRPLAKDGADLPPRVAARQTAAFSSAPGETHDFEVLLRPGVYRLEMTSRDDAVLTINVR